MRDLGTSHILRGLVQGILVGTKWSIRGKGQFKYGKQLTISWSKYWMVTGILFYSTKTVAMHI